MASELCNLAKAARKSTRAALQGCFKGAAGDETGPRTLRRSVMMRPDGRSKGQTVWQCSMSSELPAHWRLHEHLDLCSHSRRRALGSQQSIADAPVLMQRHPFRARPGARSLSGTPVSRPAPVSTSHRHACRLKCAQQG